MSAVSPPHNWDDAYAGAPPPWDVGHPQPAINRLGEAGELRGALLDAGCGTGEHTMLAARCGASALGIDVSPRAVERARQKAADQGVGARFEVLDALGLGDLAQTFDTIVDSGLFHVFDDDDRARYVKAVHGALAPGGHLHLMCFSDRQPGDWGPRRVREDELRAALDDGWHIHSLARDRFEVNPGFGAPAAEAWLVDAFRLPSG